MEKRLNIRLTEKDADIIGHLERLDGVSVSDFVRQAIREKIGRNGRNAQHMELIRELQALRDLIKTRTVSAGVVSGNGTQEQETDLGAAEEAEIDAIFDKALSQL